MQTKKNYTIDQILDYDAEQLHGMKTEELLDLVRGSINKVRKRASVIEKRNLENVSQPYADLKASGGYSFDLSKYGRNKDGSFRRNDIVADVMRYQQFLGAKTSSYKGLMDWDKNVAASFKNEEAARNYRNWTWDEKKKYWELVDEIKNNNAKISSGFDSEQLQSLISVTIENNDIMGRLLREEISFDQAKSEIESILEPVRLAKITALRQFK